MESNTDYENLAKNMSDKFGVTFFIKDDNSEINADEEFFYSIINKLERVFVNSEIMYSHGINVSAYSDDYDDIISILFNEHYKSGASFGCVYNYLLLKNEMTDGRIFQFIGVTGNEYNITDDKSLYDAVKRMELVNEPEPPYYFDEDEENSLTDED